MVSIGTLSLGTFAYDLKVVVLTGTGTYFWSENDEKELIRRLMNVKAELLYDSNGLIE